MAQAIEPSISYLRSSNFWRFWSNRRCEVCELEDVRLSAARAAPAVAHRTTREAAAPAEKPVPPRKRRSGNPQANFLYAVADAMEAVATFRDWLNSPPPPRPAPAPPAPPKPPAPAVPPFDIQDVPQTMRKLYMPMAAKLQERWFAGQENYSRSPQGLLDEIDQHGLRYTPTMIDSTTIKMDWVLTFPRAKEAFDELVQNKLRNAAAVDMLRTKLTPYRNRQDVVGWNEANSDFLAFHKKFQFQFKEVNATWAQRIREFLDSPPMPSVFRTI